MDITTGIKAIPIVGGAVDRVRGWYRGPAVEVTTEDTVAQYKHFGDPPYKPVDFRVRVENIGSKTIYDLRGNIYFRGVINPDDPQATVTVDTTGTWEQKGDASVSLRGGDAEWLNVLRVVQDYSAGHNFDPDTDVYLVFPAGQDWSHPTRIRTKWGGDPGDASTTSERITWEEAENIAWQEAHVEMIGEDESSNAVSTTYDIDLLNLQSQMDNRARFFIKDDLPR